MVIGDYQQKVFRNQTLELKLICIFRGYIIKPRRSKTVYFSAFKYVSFESTRGFACCCYRLVVAVAVVALTEVEIIKITNF